MKGGVEGCSSGGERRRAPILRQKRGLEWRDGLTLMSGREVSLFLT